MKPSDIVFYDCGGGERPAQANPYGIQLRDVMAGSDGGAIARCKAASLVRKTGSRYQTRPAVARFAFVFYDRSGAEGRATGSTGESKRPLGCERRPRLANAGSRYQALPPVASIDNALSDIAQPLPREFGVPTVTVAVVDMHARRMAGVSPNIRTEGNDRCGTEYLVKPGLVRLARPPAPIGNGTTVGVQRAGHFKFTNRRRLAATTSFGEYLSAINDRVVHGSQHDRGDEQCRFDSSVQRPYAKIRQNLAQ